MSLTFTASAKLGGLVNLKTMFTGKSNSIGWIYSGMDYRFRATLCQSLHIFLKVFVEVWITVAITINGVVIVIAFNVSINMKLLKALTEFY